MDETKKNILAKVIKLFAIFFVLTIPIVWISLPFTNFTGDLTRVGKLAERDFAWTKEQVRIPSNFLKSSPITEADILVVGDSFSASLIWQSVLVNKGYKVATIAWADVGYICANFIAEIKNAGFKGKYLIIETVERGAQARISGSTYCKNNNINFPNSDYQIGSIEGVPEINYSINLNGKFLIGLNTLINSISFRYFPNYLNFYNSIEKGVNVYDIDKGCNYFSNYLCNLGVFYFEDYEREMLGNKTIDEIQLINNNLLVNESRLKIIWAVVPNKSSVYHRDVSPEFWNKLEKENLGPNLYQVMMDGRTVIKDLYDPNGSHFSNSGYELMGKTISDWLNSGKKLI